MQPRRTVLYLPAANQRAIDKARGLDVEVVIFDLEDAVVPEAKMVAREQAVAAIREGGFRADAVLRVNSVATEWGGDDLAAATDAGVKTILLPKVSTATDLVAARGALPAGVALWAMIETPLAIQNLGAITAAAGDTGLTALVVGTNDLAKDARIPAAGARAALTGALGLVVLAARAHGLAVLDGVYNAIDDSEGFAAECRAARAMGFDGKTLIHPSQIEPCRAAFAPTAEEVAEAEAIVALFDAPENRDKGAVRHAGRMVERLHLEAAREMLAGIPSPRP